MRLLFKSKNFAIYDDVLTPEEFLHVFAYVSEENYSSPLNNNNWIKVWRLGDCQPVAGPARLHSQGPYNLPIDMVMEKIVEAAKNHTEFIKPYEDMNIRPYLYPRGTKLSWHDDSDVYCGAATFYCHRKWGSTWGGELVVAEAPPLAQVLQGRNVPKPHMEHDWEDQYISMYGMGHYITPKPNRLVLMAPGTYHAINRVDVDAGDHLRSSLVAFMLPKKTGMKSSATM